MTINLRNYRERDLNLMVVLFNAVDAVDHTERWTSLEEVRQELEQPAMNAPENVFVAEDGDGRLWGVGWVHYVAEHDQQGFRSHFVIHPMARERGLEDRLLARLEQRAGERIAEASSARVYFGCSVADVQTASLMAMRRSGMTEVRRFWMMLHSNLDGLPKLEAPDDLILRPYQMGEDDEPTRLALNEAFREHYAHSDETVKLWQHFIHLPIFRPDLTLIAEDPKNKNVAGMSLVVVNEAECKSLGCRRGWIDVLGVRREYRQRGLGQALLLKSLYNLRDAGMDNAALAVDSENTTGATRLYSRVGFEVHKTWIAYQKYLRGTEAIGVREMELAA